MVGLPYPNLKSPELKEKMDYLNANMVSNRMTLYSEIPHVDSTRFHWNKNVNWGNDED